MSGFAGGWHLDGEPCTSEMLRTMWAPIAHRGQDAVDDWVDGSAGVVAGITRVSPESASERQPCISPAGAVVAFNGRLGERLALARAVGLQAATPDAALVAAAYDRAGDGFAELLSGEFAVSVFDPTRQILVLARDPVGTKPLYVAFPRGAAVFGTEIKALLAHPRVTAEVDVDLLAYYLLQGTARENAWDTFFKGVRSIFPGHVVKVTPAGVKERVFWDFDVDQRIRLASYDDYVDAFRELLKQAVRRRLRSIHPVGFSVSGGIDSSAVFCQALALRDEPGMPDLVAITHVGEAGGPADEVSFVEAIERRWDVDVARIPLESHAVAAGAPAQVRASEMPWINELWPSALGTEELFRERGVRRHLTGQWGDQMLYDQAYLVDLCNRLRWWSVIRDMREIPRWEAGSTLPLARLFLRQLVHWDVPKQIVPSLRWIDRRHVGPRGDRPWYGDVLRAHGTARPPRRITVGLSSVPVHSRNVYAKLRSKYYLFAHEWDEKVSAFLGFESAPPLIDRDLVAFVMAIPGEMTNHHGRQRSILRDSMVGVLPDEVRLRRSKADFTALTNQGLGVELRRFGAGALRGSMSERFGFLKPQELESYLSHRPESEVRFMDYASHLTGLEAWLTEFFAGGVAASGGGYRT